MPTAVEALELQVRNNSNEAIKGLNSLSESLNKLKANTKNGLGLTSIINQLNKLSEATSNAQSSGVENLTKLSDSLTKLSSLGKPTNLTGFARGITKIGEALNSIPASGAEGLERTTEALGTLSTLGKVEVPSVTQAKPDTTPVPTPVTTPTTDAASDYEPVKQMADQTSYWASQMSTAGDKIKAAYAPARDIFAGLLEKVQAVRNAMVNIPSNGLSGLATIPAKLISGFGMAAGKVGEFASRLKDAVGSRIKSGLQGIINSIKNVGKQSIFSTGAIGNLVNMIKRMALRMAIRAALNSVINGIKEGVNNLYNYSSVMGGTFANSIDRLSASFQYLKNSLGAMVSPIINALAPAVDFLIDKFVSLINIINMFFARLTGASTFTAAKKQATSYGGAISDAGGAAQKAAKEIRDATLGIDELNIISQPEPDTGSGGGGGGGGGASGAGDLFEELPIDSSIADFVDKLKAAFEAGDWKQLGTLIGEKFNEVVDSIDWSGIGHKMGYAFNGAIQTVYWVLKTADFTNLGKHLAEMINSAVGEVDFTYIGRLLIRIITAALDFAIGLLGTIDWGLLGKSLGDFLIGAFKEAQEWLAKIDWGDAAYDMFHSILDFFASIDYATLAESFFKFLGTAIGAAATILNTFIVETIKSIGLTFYHAVFNDDGTMKSGIEIIHNIMWGISDAMVNIASWIWEHVIVPFVQGIGEGLSNNEANNMVKSAGRGLLEIIATTVIPTLPLLKRVYEGGLNIVKNFLKAFESSETGQVMAKWGKAMYTWFINADGNIIQKFGTVAVNVVKSLIAGFLAEHPKLMPVMGNIAKAIYEWFRAGSDIGGIVQKFGEIAGEIVTAFTNMIVAKYGDVQASMITWAQSILRWFKDIVNNNAFANFAYDIISGFRTKITNTYSSVKASMLEWAKHVLDWFTGSSNGAVNAKTFSDFAYNTIDGFLTRIKNAYTDSKSSITTWADMAKRWFTDSSYGGVNRKTFEDFAYNTIKGFKDSISSHYQETKDSITRWAKGVLDWFKDLVNANKFAEFARDIINGFKSTIESLYNTVTGSIQNWANTVNNTFNSITNGGVFAGFANNIVAGFVNQINGVMGNVSAAIQNFANNVNSLPGRLMDFYGYGASIVGDFCNGVGSMMSVVWSTISNWGSNIINSLKNALKSGSPSRIMVAEGKNTIYSFNLGLMEDMKTTADFVTDWVNSFKDIKPNLAYGFSVDTSALEYYNADRYVKSLETQVNTQSTVTATGFKDGMEAFYKDYVEPTINRMADDVRRQADKAESTVVQIGNRTITDAVITQRNANGYSFVR